MNTMASARSSAGIARWASLGGILYVVLFVIGVIVMFDGEPDSDASPAKVIAYYQDSGHRDRISIGWIVAGLGIFFFLWFLSSLRRTVRRHEGEDGFLTALTTIGGVVYATLAFAAIAVNVGIRTMSDDTYRHQVFPELIHAADDASYVMHATGAAGLGAMIIALSLAFMWGAVWPKWAGWLGVAVGILAIGAIFFFTQWIFLLWILIVSIVMFLRGVPTARAV